MPSPSGTIAFYAVLVAPGFVAVMTAISLAALEDDHSQFVLLVWSLVSSLLIDTVFLAIYQHFNDPITAFTELPSVLFTPAFRYDYIACIFGFSVLVGIIYSGGILLDLQGRLRRVLQLQSNITYNPRQPWQNFMRDAGSIRIKTQDNELYTGDVAEYSRAGRDREVRVQNPQRYDSGTHGYEPVGREDMLFMDDDIDRVLMRSEDSEKAKQDKWEDDSEEPEQEPERSEA
ncbi:DUF6338 family protein [Halococcus thailandensis]|uniref:Uncharacterized protein n=1 Tax=Halococcus thailandensis JCM 13552 TaxID=1227457 RepID=M0NEA1_9EURY|nr:DUF6338 family protein [Halococcus thailandensis]EMA54990.1 hypothetical protein C451_05755 [Halococcus thailandensis JCM 13552]